MFSKEAIEQIQTSIGIEQANDAIGTLPPIGVVALPNHYDEYDLETYMPLRRRARGTMNTISHTEFADYVKANIDGKAGVFVEAGSMRAVAVLNLGTPDEPGHADNKAIYEPPITAAYKALLDITGKGPLTQRDVAEFLEDWRDKILCYDEAGAYIQDAQAVAAIRSLTIESVQKLESNERSLSADRTAFESIAATSKETIPARIRFTTEPYLGLTPRDFELRLGVSARDGKAPTLILRIILKEWHQEEMGKNLVAMVRQAMEANPDDTPPVYVPVIMGSYTRGA